MHILAITCVKNEAPYILEWLSHHRALGVGHFLVFSNDCDDGTDILLDEVAQHGWLTHIRHSRDTDKTIQFQALKSAAKHPQYEAADWVMFTDVDEFIALAPPLKSLADLIRAAGDADAITLPWRLFGNAGLHDIDDTPVTMRFTQAASADIALPLAHFFKTLFRSNAFREPGVHRPKPLKNVSAIWADASGAALPAGFAAQNQRINLYGHHPANPLVQLNHYSLRSTAEFLLKTKRGLPNKMDLTLDISYWAARNWNTVKDSLIARHRPDASWITGPMRSLHNDAVNWHKLRFEALMQDTQTVQAFWRLQLAGPSSEPTSQMAKTHLARLQQASKS